MKKVLFTVLFLCFALNIYAQEKSIFGDSCVVTGDDFSKDKEHSKWLYEKGSLILDNISLKDAYALVVKDLNDNTDLYHYKYLYKKYPKMPKKSVTLTGDIDKNVSRSYKCNIDITNDNNKKIEIKISAFGKTGDIILEQVDKNVQVTRKTAILDLHADAAKFNPENTPGSITNGWQKVDQYYGAIDFLCSGEKAKANEVMSMSINWCEDCTYEKYFKGMDIKSTYNALFKDLPKTFESFPKTLPSSNQTIDSKWNKHTFIWKGNNLYVRESSKETDEYYTILEFMQEKDGVKVHLSGYGAYPN